MQSLKSLIHSRRLYFDGGCGTYLSSLGLLGNDPPEALLTTNPKAISAMHREYLRSGSNLLLADTFGVNRMRYTDHKDRIRTALSLVREVINGHSDAFAGYDQGPLGVLLSPYGSLSFEDAVAVFADNMRCAEEYGADFILIETMADCLETKAALLAAKENTKLPVFVSNAYGENGKLLTGADPEAMVAMLEGLGADAVGANCSCGPEKMGETICRIAKTASVPVIAMPNASLPVLRNGKTEYDMTPESFAAYMKELVLGGASLCGGCCGTTPDYIRALVTETMNMPFTPPDPKKITVISSFTHTVTCEKGTVLIGERINPTGKPKLKTALLAHDMAYLQAEAVRQQDAGADVLDVNVGVPGIREADTLRDVVQALQEITDLPLQLDSSDPAALEAAMRCYAGKPLVNSVNAKEECLSSILPLVKKYGGSVIGLTLDENGIPDTSEKRLALALKILERAEELGIPRHDVIIDPLALTVSSDSKSARVTLETVRLLHENGIRTSLGVSNISFGLPQRSVLNAAFFTSAIQNGLDFAIINPFSEPMMRAKIVAEVLCGRDENCSGYIASFADDTVKSAVVSDPGTVTLKKAITSGLAKQAAALADDETGDPYAVISERIIPALNEIGARYGAGKAFLPQLLAAAQAATEALSVLRPKITASGGQAVRHGEIILATVEGDIHDIGKNIVKTLLESYGFTVIDLGRDVSPAVILEKAKESGCKLVGLSALMTTTVPAMEKTVRLLHEFDSGIRVVVGGAVLTKETADAIGADVYSKDAMDTVRYAEAFYGSQSSTAERS